MKKPIHKLDRLFHFGGLLTKEGNMAKGELSRLASKGLDIDLMTQASEEFNRYSGREAITPNDLLCLQICDPRGELDTMEAEGIDADLFAIAVAEYVRFGEVDGRYNLTEIFEIIEAAK